MIKKISLSLLAAAALAVFPFSSALAGGGHDAKHGGIHLAGKTIDMEIVAKPDVIQVYATDHGKPLNLTGAKAKVTLLSGSEKTEVDLASAGDKFEAKGTFKVAPGTKGIVLVTLAGKPGSTARFTVK